jgi:predicted nucleic-acid-binding protein
VIGIDTNILVRFLTRDDEEQCARVDVLFDRIEEEGGEVFVSDIVLVELVWVLEKGYRMERGVVTRSIEALLRTGGMVFQRRDVLWRVIRQYEQSGVDVADLLIAAVASEAGCERTLTLDRRAAESGGMQLL